MAEEPTQEFKKWNSPKKTKIDAGSHRNETQNDWRQNISVHPSCEDVTTFARDSA